MTNPKSGPNSAAPTTAEVVGGVYNVPPPVLTDGQATALQVDVNGKLITSGSGGGGGNVNLTGVNSNPPALNNPLPVELSDGTQAVGTAGNPLSVNVITGGGSNASVGATGVAAPASATEIGIVDGTGKLQNVSPTSPLPISAASLPLPALASTSTKQSDGSQKSQIVDGSGNVVGSTGNALDVNVKTIAAVTQTVQGNKTNNNAAPGATNVGTLPAIANAATPSWTEGDQVGLSVDLSGALRENMAEWGGTALQAAATASNDGTGANPVVRNIARRFGQILTTTPLAANGVFTSSWFDTNQTGDAFVEVSAFSNVASAVNAFNIQETDDTTNSNFLVNITTSSGLSFGTGGNVAASTLTTVNATIRKRYWRVVYTNGGTIQASFELTASATSLLLSPQPASGSAYFGNPVSVPSSTGGNVNSDGQSAFPVVLVGSSGAFNGITYPFIYNGTGSNGWDRPRTPVTFKTIAAVAVTAGTPVAIWTPTSGKKFRVMGFMLSLSVAGSVILKDATTEILRTPLMAAGIGQASPPMGNGILSAAANNVLNADVSATGSVSGFVFGTEE